MSDMNESSSRKRKSVYPKRASAPADEAREIAVPYQAQPATFESVWLAIQKLAQTVEAMAAENKARAEAQRKAEEHAEEERRKAEERAEQERRKAEEERRKAEERAEEERRKAEERAEQERRKAEERDALERKKYEERAEEDRKKAEERDALDRKKYEERVKQERKQYEEYVSQERLRREADAREDKKRTDKLESMFNLQWGRLVESLVEGDLVPLLNERGIHVQQTTRRHTGCYQGRNFELDIIAIDGDTIVVVEVKTTLTPYDVRNFLVRVSHVREWISVYADKRVLGAVAYLQESGSAATMAAKRGLFVIRATGSSASITNPPDFQPQHF
jgi:hypothetical protein